MIQRAYRQGVLGVADSPVITSFIKRHGWRLGVGRFVAGQTSEEAIAAIAALEARGLGGILDLLGEFIDTREGALSMTRTILEVLGALQGRPIEPYLSVKPTQLGLGLGPELALENARAIAQKARELGGHVCLDMENHPYVDGTLELVTTLHAEGFHNVSTVLQSYLYRSEDDLKRLLALAPQPEVRIVKGAYNEPPEVAYGDKPKVDRAFRELVFLGLEEGAKINIASHDERLIAETEAFVRGAKLGPERYEFQLLYGVRPGLQERLKEAGHRVRIYVPFGEDWYGYFSRRLAERPANLLFVLRGLAG